MKRNGNNDTNIIDNNSNYKLIDNISLLPSSYEKIEALEIINPPKIYESKNSIRSFFENLTKKSIYVYPTNTLNSLTFNWVYHVIKNRKKNQKLKLDSLSEISPKLKSKTLFNKIKPKWAGKYEFLSRNKKNQKCCPLFLTLVQSNLKQIVIILFLFGIFSIWDTFSVIIFKELLLLFKNNDISQIKPESRNWILKPLNLKQLVILMIINKISSILLNRQLMFLSDLLNNKTTSQLNLLIYDKLLKIATYNKNTFNEGQITNLMQKDSGQFGMFLVDSSLILTLPFNFIFSIYLLFNFFGLAFIPGFIVLVLLLLIFYFLGKTEEKYLNEKMKATDDRMNVVSQTFNIIRMIKLYSWENFFKQKIRNKRKIELNLDEKQRGFHVLVNTIYFNADNFLFFVCVVSYNLFYHQMETDKLLTALYVIQGMVDPLFFVPEFFISLYEAIVSLKRIQKFLLSEDNDYSQIKYLSENGKEKSPYAIEISHVDFGVDNNIDDENVVNNNKMKKMIKTIKIIIIFQKN